MKLSALVLVLPVVMAIGFVSGCGSSTEPVVIEAEPMTAEEEATYEEESYGNVDDEAQN
ncbi:MAG: hypothetical protein ACR2NZ_17605 [Rubripirellula sp.]